jgi:hypothetical protein
MRIYALRPMIRAGGRPTLEADPTEANLSTHTTTNSASVFISDASLAGIGPTPHRIIAADGPFEALS